MGYRKMIDEASKSILGTNKAKGYASPYTAIIRFCLASRVTSVIQRLAKTQGSCVLIKNGSITSFELRGSLFFRNREGGRMSHPP